MTIDRNSDTDNSNAQDDFPPDTTGYGKHILSVDLLRILIVLTESHFVCDLDFTLFYISPGSWRYYGLSTYMHI